MDELALESWRDVYALLKSEPAHFAFFDADQIVKHYLGLKRVQHDDQRAVTLMYLY